jgi:hypothetical protein
MRSLWQFRNAVTGPHVIDRTVNLNFTRLRSNVCIRAYDHQQCAYYESPEHGFPLTTLFPNDESILRRPDWAPSFASTRISLPQFATNVCAHALTRFTARLCVLDEELGLFLR